jgi:ribonucleoside-diphosphate reductase alpha chain
VSRGLTRHRPLSVVRGSSGEGGNAGASVSAIGGTSAPRGEAVGAVALKAEPEAKLSPAQKLEFRAEAIPDAKADAKVKRAEAKAQGYEGDPCGECQNYTLVRNGTCMKCNTCGSTTGCS